MLIGPGCAVLGTAMSEGVCGNGGVQLDRNAIGVSGLEWHNLDYGASALVLTYLDSESLCRSEAVSKSFKESVGNAWTVLAIEKGLVEDVVVVPPGTWNFHTLSLCVASRYAKEVANMSDEDMRSEGRLLSVLHPSSDDYDFFIRFSSGGDALLSEGFFSPVNMGRELVPMLDQTFHLGDADLSQWSAMEEFLNQPWFPWTDEVDNVLDEAVPEDLRITIISLHRTTLQTSILFRKDEFDNGKPRTAFWAGRFGTGRGILDLFTPEEGNVFMSMHFKLNSVRDVDLNDWGNWEHLDSRDACDYIVENLHDGFTLCPTPDEAGTDKKWVRCLQLHFENQGWNIELNDLVPDG